MVSRRAFFATLACIPFLRKNKVTFPNDSTIEWVGVPPFEHVNPTLPADYRRRLLLSEERRRELLEGSWDPNGGHVPTARELFEQECRREGIYYRGIQH